jgi:tRNA (guanine37-N1)-methyltransferase
MRVTILTLFPEAFETLRVSVLGRALEQGLWQLELINIRDFGTGLRKNVDGACYGGGAGMVLKPDVLDRAMDSIVASCGTLPLCVYLSAKGPDVDQVTLTSWSAIPHLVLLCARYEGVDQRALDFWLFQEWRVGSFVVCGGEAPAMMLVEGCVRWIPGVLGNAESLLNESFQNGCLEHPHYTHPRVWKGMEVPAVLLSGHHKNIAAWRRQHAVRMSEPSKG